MRRGLRGPLCVLASLVVALAGGCQDKESGQSGQPQTHEEPHASQPQAHEEPRASQPKPEAEEPKFKVDGKKLQPGELAEETTLLSLKVLPPIEQWKLLIVHSIDSREFRATKPSLLTGERTMKLVKRADQSYEFVVMEHAESKDTIRHRMPRVKIVEIQTHGYTPPAPKRGPAIITIQIAGKASELGAQQLDPIKRTPQPGSEGGGDTWLLLDLLGTPSLAKGQSIVLHPSSGDGLTLSAEQVSDSKVMHLIKRNRRGKFHYRQFSLDDPPQKTAELRSLKLVELR